VIGIATNRAGAGRPPAERGGPGTVDRRSDGALVAAARAGSREAAGELVGRHWPGVWRAALAITGRSAMAEDVAQDAFERAFAALGRFDLRRPFAPWLHRIAVNRALDLVRRERRLVALDAMEERGPALAAAAVGEGVDADLLRALDGLSAERRAAVVLRYGLGYTPAEIAPILGVPVGTVHSRLARALEQLRDELGADRGP
jgi:RNA polymerase sigma-70 factor, ECF subfamily